MHSSPPAVISRAEPRRQLTARSISLVAVGVIIAATSTCSSSDSTADTVTVPVLWAAVAADSAPVGGIENAEITAATDLETEFVLDLTTVEARGAGPKWRAASALAATVATLHSGEDPRPIDLIYSISGQIEGPSGGALLTIGTLAALRGDPLRRDTTMTGTIGPDGTIGTVGLVPVKLQAAADAGYEVVLIPAGNAMSVLIGNDGRPSGPPVNMVEFGRELGLEVIPVSDLGEAYTAMTGVDIDPPARALTDPPPALIDTIEITTARLLERIETSLADVAGDDFGIDQFEQGADAVRDAYEAGQYALAYGLGVDTLQNIDRRRAADQLANMVNADGQATAISVLSDEIQRLIVLAESDIVTASEAAIGLGIEHQVALPAALGWSVYCIALLESIEPALVDPAVTLVALESYARSVADCRLSIEVFGRDAIETVIASSSAPVPSEQQLADFLSGYTNFLIRSADASLAYFSTLRGVDGADNTVAGTVLGAANALSERVARISTPPESLEIEIRELALALTQAVLAETLVGGPSFGLADWGYGKDPDATGVNWPVLENSVVTGTETARRWAAALGEAGDGIDHVVWQTAWATALFDSLRGTDRGPAGAVIALNEVWYAVITALMVAAATDALSGG